MLVLSRRFGEAIQIGTEVVVKVISIRGGRVRLAIEGPRHIRMRRAELIRTEEGPHGVPPARQQGDVRQRRQALLSPATDETPPRSGLKQGENTTRLSNGDDQVSKERIC